MSCARRKGTYVNELVLDVFLHDVLVVYHSLVIVRAVPFNVYIVAFLRVRVCVVVINVHVEFVILDWLGLRLWGSGVRCKPKSNGAGLFRLTTRSILGLLLLVNNPFPWWHSCGYR